MNKYWRYWRIRLARLARHRRKRFAFALGAILIGLLPLLITEVTLRCCGLGLTSDLDDPYIDFANVRPLFHRNEETGQYEIGPERQTFFQPDSFAIDKPKNEFRIFCLGGSTVQGRPYAIETSFTTWLELNLQSADPRYQWQVVNCGGVSYASYRLVPILQELLDYQPDMFIICTGQNEFLEDRTYGPIKQTPRWILRSHAWLSRLRTYNLLRKAAVRLREKRTESDLKGRPLLPEEVDALLDYYGGLDEYQRDPAWRNGTIAHFRFNLNRMLSIALERGIPVLLVNPPYNLKDTPPFKYLNRSDITAEEKTQFDELWEQAKQEGLRVAERIALLKQAVDIDDQHAGVRFHLGRCYYSSGEFDQSKRHLLAAKDEDICPLRILSPMRQSVFEAAQVHSVPLVDAQQLFEQLSPHGITGNEWFVDHVHPSIKGHQQLASALFDVMVAQGWVKPTDAWQSRRDATLLKHLQSLDAMYYIRGQQRLEGLQTWTQGRVRRIKGSGELLPPAADSAAQ